MGRQKHKLGSHSRPRLDSLEPARVATVETWPRYKGPKGLCPKRVDVFGSKLCECCTKVRKMLEVEGWKYRWHECNKHTIVQLNRMFPGWNGGLPCIRIDGVWLNIPSQSIKLENGMVVSEVLWAPWPIRNPKKRGFIPLD